MPQRKSSDSTADESDQGPQSVLPMHLRANGEAAGNGDPSSPRIASLSPRSSTSSNSDAVISHDAQQTKPSISSAQNAKRHSNISSSSDDAVSVQIGFGEGPKPLGNAAQKPKGKLGRIGGRLKADGEEKSRTTASRDSATPSSRLEPKKHDNRLRAAQDDISPNRKGRSTTQPSNPSLPRETSQERANKKREQLKRELESKSSVGAKKKRKF